MDLFSECSSYYDFIKEIDKISPLMTPSSYAILTEELRWVCEDLKFDIFHFAVVLKMISEELHRRDLEKTEADKKESAEKIKQFWTDLFDSSFAFGITEETCKGKCSKDYKSDEVTGVQQKPKSSLKIHGFESLKGIYFELGELNIHVPETLSSKSDDNKRRGSFTLIDLKDSELRKLLQIKELCKGVQEELEYNFSKYNTDDDKLSFHFRMNHLNITEMTCEWVGYNGYEVKIEYVIG